MTFTEWKRRVVVGTQLLCVEQTYQPKLVGQTRTVNKVQTVGIRCDPNFWTRWPKAKDVTFIDDNTAKWPLWPDQPDKVVALRILEG